MPIATEEPIAAETFRIAIIGGGIGGLTAALSIATYSAGRANITVYEQAPEYGEIGAGVGIGIQAGRVLQKLGVWDAANAISGDRSGVHRSSRRYDNDEVIVDVPAISKDGLMNGIGQLWVHRAEFLEVLYNEIRKRGCAKLETNKRAVKLEVCSANVKDSPTPYLGVC
jgi:salicylate hydroxylase